MDGVDDDYDIDPKDMMMTAISKGMKPVTLMEWYEAAMRSVKISNDSLS